MFHTWLTGTIQDSLKAKRISAVPPLHGPSYLVCPSCAVVYSRLKQLQKWLIRTAGTSHSFCSDQNRTKNRRNSSPQASHRLRSASNLVIVPQQQAHSNPPLRRQLPSSQLQKLEHPELLSKLILQTPARSSARPLRGISYNQAAKNVLRYHQRSGKARLSTQTLRRLWFSLRSPRQSRPRRCRTSQHKLSGTLFSGKKWRVSCQGSLRTDLN
jgi:hypothetical protein